ncbi:hypothetical protein BASA81_005805 [Batrachochytrium salamandrivorans]|nr:hypothetical protein BASA81_005805 [Batrachochytrium salamandrivorans]
MRWLLGGLMLCLMLAGLRRPPPFRVVNFSSDHELAAYLPAAKSLALYFTAEYNATTGKRWCEDSEEVNDLVFSNILPSLLLPPNSVASVIVIEVSRQDWKHSPLYRSEPYFLKEIPSLVLVSDHATPIRVFTKNLQQVVQQAGGGD